jgi:predicted glycoside hydrolase/deacetylase ChbG (UPF0249 family)
MGPNPLLKELGLSNEDRVVILHADDVGMCQSSLAAYVDLLDFGLISSAVVMVPCPWFPATAAFCRSHPADAIDMGVHLTFTCEWDGYRWGPISSCENASGLIDESGYFHATSAAVQEYADPETIQHEAGAQVERALVSGIDVTHVDTHMGSLVHPKFFEAYVQVALQHHVPPFMPRVNEAWLQEELGLGPETIAQLVQQVRQSEGQGVPLMDNIHVMPLDEPDNRTEQVKQVLDALPAGITQLNIHPAQDTPELRAIAPDWRARVSDYWAFTSQELRAYVRDSGIQVIGWRVLRELVR